MLTIVVDAINQLQSSNGVRLIARAKDRRTGFEIRWDSESEFQTPSSRENLVENFKLR